MAVRLADKFIPILDRVLVRRIYSFKTLKCGISIPEHWRSDVLRATVIAVGPGARDVHGKFIPMNVKVGDEVFVPDYCGMIMDFEDDSEEEYRLFNEPEILAKFVYDKKK